MKIPLLTLLGLLVLVACASAQITVEVVIDQEQFLRDESLPVKVRVTNRSGKTLSFGKDNQWLDFVVQDGRGQPVARSGEVPVTGEFNLEAGQVATRKADLMPYFDLAQPGRYQVTATVRIKEWNAEAVSKAKHFEIVRGTRLWEEEFGVPLGGGAPDMRKYSLQQANYQKQLKLYARLTDAAETKVIGVLALGPLVSFSHPEAQLDKEGNLYVLFQIGARSFTYMKVNCDGMTLVRQTHDYSSTRPVLRRDDSGKIVVAGGQRRLSMADIPPTPLTNFLGTLPPVEEDIPQPKPVKKK